MSIDFGYIPLDDRRLAGHGLDMARRSKERPDVYGYLDYRAYLRDEYAARKAEGRGFSFRAFSKRAGLQSPNHLKRVIDGERSLNQAMAVRYARALDLDEDRTAFFCDMVSFSQAETDLERNAAYLRIRSNRSYQRANRLELAHAAYTSSWYLPAIRELVNVKGFTPDPAEIGRRLLPPVPAAEVARALETLLALQLVKETEGGGLEQGEILVTTGPETRGLHIRNYHRAMLERAAQSMELTPAAERDISSLTFTADDELLTDIKQRIQAFRKELIARIAEAGSGTRVVQLNFQLFPLSTIKE